MIRLLILALLALTASANAKGSSYAEAPYSAVVKQRPCMWQATKISWIDLNSIVKLETVSKAEVAIYVAGVKSELRVSVENAQRYVEMILAEQKICQ